MLNEKTYYSIGEVAAICNTSVKTLRYYDEIKLVIPKVRKEESKYRYYTKEQMVTILIIRKLRMLGFALKEIKEIVYENGSQVHVLENQIQKKLACIQGEIENLQKKSAEGQAFLHRLQEGTEAIRLCEEVENFQKDRLNQIVIQNIPQIHLYHSRKMMEMYHNEEVSIDRWIEINEEVEKRGMKACGPVIVTYYTELLDQFLSKDCDIEFGIQVENCDSDKVREFGGFQAATAFHVGPYREVIKTHIKVLQWVNQNNYKIAGPVSEEFIISPVDVQNEKEHVTKIVVPVA